MTTKSVSGGIEDGLAIQFQVKNHIKKTNLFEGVPFVKSLKTVLIVEDEQEVNSCIRDILEKDFRVLTACCAEEGMSILKKKKVSLVVLDYLLPDMDGLEILKAVKMEYKIPVIMITAYGDKELLVECVKYKADYYFDKPFVFKELRDKVREFLKEDYPYNILGLEPFSLSTDTRKALEYVGRKLSDTKGNFWNFGLKDIAAVTSVSPKYLSFLVKKECDININECINILRVEKAKELLKDKDRDIKEIAYQLGFKHSNSFTRLFKKLTDKPPSFFKK